MRKLLLKRFFFPLASCPGLQFLASTDLAFPAIFPNGSIYCYSRYHTHTHIHISHTYRLYLINSQTYHVISAAVAVFFFLWIRFKSVAGRRLFLNTFLTFHAVNVHGIDRRQCNTFLDAANLLDR